MRFVYFFDFWRCQRPVVFQRWRQLQLLQHLLVLVVHNLEKNASVVRCAQQRFYHPMTTMHNPVNQLAVLLTGEYLSEGASIAYMESTVVDISIPPSSFKPVSLSLSRSPLFLKYSNKFFFNPINIFWIYFGHLFTHYSIIHYYQILLSILTGVYRC